MNKTGFQWVVPPNAELMPNIIKYGERALVAVQAAANYWGQSIQDVARQGANWEDRTGNARSGLFFAVDGFELGTLTGTVSSEAQSQLKDIGVESGSDKTLIITLSHTVYYGKFLELSNGGKYAVIMSTLEENLPRLERMIQELFR